MKFCKEYPEYGICSDGTIYSTKTNKFLNVNSNDNTSGYQRVQIKNTKGKYKKVFVHRLVALLFVEGQSEEANIVNHVDSDKKNNRYKNLEWTNKSGNAKHAIAAGKVKVGEDRSDSKYTEEKVRDLCEFMAEGCSPSKAAKMVNVPEHLAYDVWYRNTWKHVSKDFNW